MDRRGFTLTELVLTVALISITMAIVVPGFATMLQRMRVDGAVRDIVSDVRDARAKAINTGWEYRVVGYRAASPGPFRNHYRVMARSSPAVTWPADNVDAFESSTQIAERWVEVGSRHPGVSLKFRRPRFNITFDSRGAAPTAAGSFNPLEIIGEGGQTTTLAVSVVGSVTID